MELTEIRIAAFSPTGTTKRVLQAIAEGTGAEAITDSDFTLPDSAQNITIAKHEPVIFGIPVYAGRIPDVAVQRLRSFKGDQTPAILVAVYGNRRFEDALLELRTIVIEQGFVPIAAAAFIGEHSFATPNKPIAMGRPDHADLNRARDFGKAIAEKFNTDDNLPIVTVPGNRPYRNGMKPGTITPSTIVDACTLCGVCADVCPTGAITVTDVVITIPSMCILCCACVRQCPTEARIMDDSGIAKTRNWLWNDYSARREPEVFLP